MSTVCFLSAGSHKTTVQATCSVKARVSLAHNAGVRVVGIGDIIPFNSNSLGNKASVKLSSSISSKNTFSYNAKNLLRDGGVFDIKSHLKLQGNARGRVSFEGVINDLVADKFAAVVEDRDTLDNFIPTEKLYPISDIIKGSGTNYFVDKYSTSGTLFSQVDEGVVLGDYTRHGGSGVVISDERGTYIHPSSVFSDGVFRLKFGVTRPLVTAKSSYLFLRAAAPVADYRADIPPRYTISNIKLEDPSGNLIIKYKDISLRGDADYETNYRNFTTYITEPETNNLLLHTWDDNYPFMEAASGYTLNLEVQTEFLDDPFADGFDFGYEDYPSLDYVQSSGDSYLSLGGSPLGTQAGFSLNPNNSIRISAIEIANSGGMGGLLRESFINFYSEVNSIGQRNTRQILPVEVVPSYTDIDVYPDVYSVWKSSPDGSGNIAYNTTPSGSKVLAGKLQDSSLSHYITLDSNTVEDSGRLTLKFSHKAPIVTQSYAEGAFSFGGVGNEFDSAEWQTAQEVDSYFVVDSIELRVVAKKASGSPNYVLDVVGYSDDRLLNVTPRINTFLQNKDGIYNLSTGDDEIVTEDDDFIVVSGQSFGVVPISSGFVGSNEELGIASQALSTKDQYGESPLVSHYPGDHYKLSDLPVISSTTFQEYVIPLDIYEDNVTLGQSRNYEVSPNFESLYLDLYPIPSGASISTAYLVVTYKPSNALCLHTFGQPDSVEYARRPYTLYPNEIDDNCIVNGEGQLSVVDNIPHAYASNSGVRSNYARRWRGASGTSYHGPFNPNEFDFSFNNPQSLYPFNVGHYDFTNVDELSGIYNFWQDDIDITTHPKFYLSYAVTPEIIHNDGLRFNSYGIFATTHSTLDWTRITGYENDILYGKIADSFSSALRLSGIPLVFDDSDVSMSGGFGLFVRWSPDVMASGVGYDLWNSGVLAGKWSTGNDLEFAVGYSGGYLTAWAQDTSGNIVQIQDTTPFFEYQYPLSTLITYNDADSRSLRLYVDSELDDGFDVLRASSQSFDINSPVIKSPISIGTIASGVGMPMFVTDVGLSLHHCNILSSGELDRLLGDTYSDSVFDELRMPFTTNANNPRYMLPNFVDENTDDWEMGDFTTMSFSPSFSFLTKRSGSDFIVHSLKHSGSGYSQFTTLPLPSNVPLSGVSYHTQIENDFLRFNLTDVEGGENAFYATDNRIHKNIPRGYNFEERAIYVDTVVEQSGTTVVWEDGSVGPRFIVSLYTKNQEPIDRPSKKNWGLINRKIHQIRPSGGMHKLKTVFTYDDLFDEREPWGAFDPDTAMREFTHNYREKDIREMFVQYDIVYPSGREIDSIIKIHTTNVKLENAVFKERNYNSTLGLVSSGEQYQVSSLNLNTFGLDFSYNTLGLFGSGTPTPTASSIMNFHCSGATLAYDALNTYCHNVGESYQNLNLWVDGRFPQFDDQILPLILTVQPNYSAASGNVSLFVNNRALEPLNDTLNIFTRGRRLLESRNPLGKMNLFVGGLPYWRSTENNFNLYLDGKSQFDVTDSSLNIFSVTYPENNEDGSFRWDG